MKALTISQPYASLIASGEKWVENRRRRTNYRGPLAIHAGKGTQYMTRREMECEGLPCGVVVAVAELVACVLLSDLRLIQIAGNVHLPLQRSGEGPTVAEVLQHEHAEGPWCWVLANVQPITPVPWKGAQGLWELPDDFREITNQPGGSR